MIDFQEELNNIKLNRKGKIVSLHKPILLLLAISEIIRGRSNEFLYDDLEPTLKLLLTKYGLKKTKKINPQYPFLYLAGNPAIWRCSIKKDILKHPDAVSRKDILGSYGNLSPEFYNYIKTNKNGINCIHQILNSYWPEAYHSDILYDLGLFDIDYQLQSVKKERSRKFVEEVLDAYERKCAICNQSIRLGDALVGIDACHLKPIQHFGEDNINNGIALCKTHHWAIDRGALSISNEMGVLVSKKLNGNKLFEYFTSFENKEVFIPRNKQMTLNENNIIYHNEYIFVK
jgi:putative restriction endonuclease